ncbi:hypothetical protein BHE74_00044965 [Ensete ventricosum]|nr:hypothetical protein GW17_00047123 [Ensete ventricosum]RWW48926.1 hypothetical protein BHE74_00044965 [Ensete ventricosum]RZS11134.1 hypothetical protein BHM03_00042438 [Ensete ventricosum]
MSGAVVAAGLIRRVAHRRLLGLAARLAWPGLLDSPEAVATGNAGRGGCWRPYDRDGTDEEAGARWLCAALVGRSGRLCFTATYDGGAGDDGDAAVMMIGR